MRKYRIVIEGKNFLLKNDVKKSGFFTTRYVEGKNETEATHIALNLIRDEIKSNVGKGSQNNPEMFVKEIVELESFKGAKVPGSGFSWFLMEK